MVLNYALQLLHTYHYQGKKQIQRIHDIYEVPRSILREKNGGISELISTIYVPKGLIDGESASIQLFPL